MPIGQMMTSTHARAVIRLCSSLPQTIDSSRRRYRTSESGPDLKAVQSQAEKIERLTAGSITKTTRSTSGSVPSRRCCHFPSRSATTTFEDSRRLSDSGGAPASSLLCGSSDGWSVTPANPRTCPIDTLPPISSLRAHRLVRRPRMHRTIGIPRINRNGESATRMSRLKKPPMIQPVG
eukprot:scaffold26314_cov63-Phaeocystis_antarctica.AAC.2